MEEERERGAEAVGWAREGKVRRIGVCKGGSRGADEARVPAEEEEEEATLDLVGSDSRVGPGERTGRPREELESGA